MELTYPLRQGSFHRVRNFQDHINAGAGPWFGIDDGCVVGTDILAVEDGAISNVEKRADAGGWNFRLNLSKYPGWFCWYAHNSQLPTNGQVFKRGQVVAKSGATGTVSGPHSHWSLLQNFVPKDPEKVATFTQGGGDEMITQDKLQAFARVLIGHELNAQEVQDRLNQEVWAGFVELFNTQESKDYLASKDQDISLLQNKVKELTDQISVLQKQVSQGTVQGLPENPNISELLEVVRRFFKKWLT